MYYCCIGVPKLILLTLVSIRLDANTYAHDDIKTANPVVA